MKKINEEETYTEKVKRWLAVERGEVPDTYDNAFLSHMGFYDGKDDRKWEKEQQKRFERDADIHGGYSIKKITHGYNES